MLAPPIAIRRARQYARARAAAYWATRTLAVTDALLCLALFAIGGLLTALIVTRGTCWLSPLQARQAPTWLAGELPIRPTETVVLTDTGLYPVAAPNQSRSSPWTHRAGAALLRRAMFSARPLRGNLGALLTLLAAGLGLLLLLAFVRQGRRHFAIDAAQAAAANLRHQVHRQLYRIGQSSLPTEGTSPVVNLFSREATDLRDGLIAEIDARFRIPVLVAGLLLIAGYLSIPLTLFLLSLGALAVFLIRTLERSSLTEADAAGRDAAVHLCLLQEDLGMLRTVRVYGVEGIDKDRFSEHLDAYDRHEVRRLKGVSGWGAATLLIGGAAMVLAIGVVGFVVLGGEGPSRLSPTAALVILTALVAVFRPVRVWLDLRSQIHRAGRSAAAVFAFLERRPELQQAVGAQFLPPLKGRITFENVSLDSGPNRSMLSGFSAEVPAKSRTAIVGLDEASKLAVACLIARLIDPKVGRVRMDGMDLRDVTLESLRAQVAIVLQADLVFSDSVATNIGLADPSFPLPRIIEAAKVAHAHNFIQELPDGYDTLIGPLGHYLKPDEQYRIALARAYLHDPSILIIEEPTAHFDEETKQMIDDAVDRICTGRTVVFLPHRLSTIRKCEQVIVLHNGHTEAAGAPRELHAQSKLYRHIQYVEFHQFATGEVEAGQMNA